MSEALADVEALEASYANLQERIDAEIDYFESEKNKYNNKQRN